LGYPSSEDLKNRDLLDEVKYFVLNLRGQKTKK
jgi:hypothetical protein